MIRHIVMFKFKEFAEGRSKAENLAEAKRRMLALREEIPEIVSMEVFLGAPGSADTNYDYILVSTFRSMEEMLRYQKHPSHVAFGNFVKALRESDGRASIDYELEE
ncbi:Dabb family protein [Neglectibacter timonensis]|uniref:Dabb family protein n=1 Tax=Neglectibacter timonensis TaxID=1776382 RepID=UPI00210ED8F5|nr:Dabb family protein [Neglectibacter timonensis]MCQ4842662.1 Dabb family protein [Neglectibacter timonensis]